MEHNLDKYKLLVESANDIIYETDRLGNFIYINPKSVELTGYSKKELIGTNYLHLVKEDYRSRVQDFYQNQFSETLKSTYIELPLIKKDGSVLWIGQNVKLLENSRGIIGVMAIARNITSRYEAQNALKISEAKYRSVIQNLQFGLMEVDLEGNVIFANDAMFDITGYSKDELIGQNAEYLLLANEAQKAMNTEHKKRQSGIASAYELALNDKEGNQKWVLISGAPKFDIEGNVTGSIGLHIDITDRKRSENELNSVRAKLNKYKLGAESINEISSNTSLSFKDQLLEGLKIAAQFLNLPVGILSSVENGQYEILEFYSDIKDFRVDKGVSMALEDTYCDLILNTGDKIAIEHFSNSEFSHNRCYKNFGMEAFIGCSYAVDGKIKGGVSFVAPEKRVEKFDNYDLEFIELFAKWAGFVVSRKDTLDTLEHERFKLETQNRELQLKESYLIAINDFVTKLLENESIENIAWEIAENVIDRFGYEDCVIYVISKEHHVLEQLAAYGPKKNKNREILNPIRISIGEGIVGTVAQTGVAEIVNDTTKDKRYIKDDRERFSEIAVPIIADNQVIGVIDSEHVKKNFFTQTHLATLETISNLAANRIKHAIAKKETEKAEQNLKDSELKMRNILHSAIDGVISIDERGIITEWNKQAESIFGYTFDEVVGKTLQETIIPENFRDLHTKGMDHFHATGEGPVLNQKIEISALRKNGEEFPIELAIIPVVMNEVHSFTAFVSDITVQRGVKEEMEKALQKEKELNELKSRFVAMTSHEFKTPLTTIKQNIDLINYKLESQLPEAASGFSKYIQRIESEISRVTNLMNDVLMLGKLDGGKVSLKPEELDFVGYVRQIIDKMRESRPDGRRIELNIWGVPRPVVVDPSLFDHILHNLISNAFKYSEGQPNPEMSLEFNELNNFRIKIKDYGIGIPEKDQKGLFQTFYRATNVKNIQGTGLGLSIVREFTLMHDGDIKFVSNTGIGTEFILDIPYK